ncbi:MAG: DUF2705 family protein [Oscillospiraceae bacterium]|nr:DUF2705 family protein [Oscillospiraceae bacterium]
MNWLKLLRYDLRNGVLRWRYLCVPVVFWPVCFSSWVMIYNSGNVGSWMDYLMGCFKGVAPVYSVDELAFPIGWFLVMAGCLFLNLDYPMNDLTEAGQQVIIRCVDKKGWFLSKCVWCLVSTGAYVALGALTALVYALISGGSADLVNTPQVTLEALWMGTARPLEMGQAVMAALVLPYLTLAALGMAQMALSLVIKPTISFLICVSALVMAMFIDSPYMIGNGAMVIRSALLDEGGQDPVQAAVACLVIIGLSMILGILRFQRMDHLRYEE